MTATFLPLALYGWTSGGPPIGAYDFAGISIDPATPNVIYASDGNGFFRSDDAGGHWVQLSTTPLTAVLAIDPSDSMIVYDAAGGGVLRSSDGGHTWEQANSGITCAAIVSITVSGSSPNVLYAAGDNQSHTPGQCTGVFRSDDFGDHWTQIPVPPTDFIRVDPVDPDIAYGMEFGFLPGQWRTIDGGAHVLSLGFSPDGPTLAIDPTDPKHLFSVGLVYGQGDGLIESRDRAQTWQVIAKQAGEPSSIVIDPVSPNVLFAFFGGAGVFRSGDGGHSWHPFGLEGEQVYELAIDSEGRYLHASVVGKGIFDQPLSQRVVVPAASPEPSLPRVHRAPDEP